MNTLAWNCRGLGNPYKVQSLLKIQKIFQPSIIFISETKKLASELHWIRCRLNFSGCFGVDRDRNTSGFSGGLALFWTEDTSVDILSFSLNHIDAIIDDTWRITGIYGWPESENKWKTGKLILDLAPKCSLPWMLFRDFNLILDNSEKRGGIRRTQSQLDILRSALSACNLATLPFSGNPFTWRSTRGSEIYIQARLDRAVADRKWASLFPRAATQHIADFQSDHSPILVHLSGIPSSKGKPRFRYNNVWSKDQACVEAIQSNWNETAQASNLSDLWSKLNSSRSTLIQWRQNHPLNYAQQIKQKQSLLNQLPYDLHSSADKEIAFNLHKEIRLLSQLEDDYWRQRAKIHWIKDGDHNTRLFHSSVTNRKKKNSIVRLKDGNNNWISEEVTAAIVDFLNGGAIPEDFNSTHIVLIPKLKNPETLNQFRPISLSNLLYKLAAKVLASRLKKILPGIISPFQSAFLSGLLISDNVVLAYELSYTIKSKTGQTGWCAIKTDMSKAFDRVEWSFLRAIMLKLGFSTTWTNWIMRCISSVSFAVIINSLPSKIFKPERGLRQWDPLSPFLFILCAEGLSSLLFFVKAVQSDIVVLKDIFDVYEEASGQSINLSKSAIYFSPNTDRPTRRNVKEKLGISEVLTHDKYLGLPLLVGSSKVTNFKHISEKVWKRINSWSSRFLSNAGKDVLIRAVIQAIPTYSMGCFSIPQAILEEIEKAIRYFWWKGTNTVRWVNWNIMTTSKRNGGLGIRNLSAFNLAMLAKQGWRILQNPNSLLSRSLKAKYFPFSSFFEANLENNPSLTWRSILKGRDTLFKGGIWRVANGKSIRIREDSWHPTVSLSSHHYEAFHGRGIRRISQVLNQERTWNTGLLRSIVGDQLAPSIPLIPIRATGPDLFAWKGTKDNIFSVRSAYYVAVENLNRDPVSFPYPVFWNLIWKLLVPPKIKLFLWRVGHQSLATRDNLRRRGMLVL
ncbi:uncharacterized protein [Rutidosis leptorrhynchoides]|uniref:uncharacterized protein n=1 Tax=Rutidosis leptorrhynchoides TaxID=125765 RepID=UPI003A99FF8C